MSARFVHFHLHSEYSLVDSTIRIKALVDACVREGMPAVALTDDSNMFALVKFYKACSGAGVKPIGGCDLWIGSADDPRPWRLTVVCQDREGYLNLSRLVSRAWREGQHGGKALVEAHWLTPETTGGLIALLGRESEAGRIAIWGARGTRSSAIFDVDGDGDLDIVTNDFNAAPMVLISNLSEKAQVRYVAVKLTGSSSNRNGLGAVVKVTAGGATYTKVFDGNSGYLSHGLYPLYFGLGAAPAVDGIEVQWPSGKKQSVPGPFKMNSMIGVREE